MSIAISLLNGKLALKKNGRYPRLPSTHSMGFSYYGKEIDKVFLTTRDVPEFIPLFTPVLENGKETEVESSKSFSLRFIPNDFNRPEFIEPNFWNTLVPCYLCKTLSRSYYLNSKEDSNKVIMSLSKDQSKFSLRGTIVQDEIIINDFEISNESYYFDEKITFI